MDGFNIRHRSGQLFRTRGATPNGNAHQHTHFYTFGDLDANGDPDANSHSDPDPHTNQHKHTHGKPLTAVGLLDDLFFPGKLKSGNQGPPLVS